MKKVATSWFIVLSLLLASTHGVWASYDQGNCRQAAPLSLPLEVSREQMQSIDPALEAAVNAAAKQAVQQMLQENAALQLQQQQMQVVQMQQKDRSDTTCAVCAETFNYPCHLTEHMLKHTGEKPCKCEWPGCKKRFARSNGLKTHMRDHTGKRPYVCTCGKAFKDLTGCNTHIKIISKKESGNHQVNRLLTDKNLEQERDTLQRQKNTITIYKCPWPDCTMSFAYIHPLQVHYRGHTGKNPYVCGCGGAFKELRSCSKHIEKMNKEQPEKHFHNTSLTDQNLENEKQEWAALKATSLKTMRFKEDDDASEVEEE